MEKLKLSPKLIGKTEWISGNRYDDMDRLAYLNLEDDGRVVAVFSDMSTMDVSELFPVEIIHSYQSHEILVRY